jgi:hypothetical protein
MAGVSATRRSELAGRDLAGKDLTPVLSSPKGAGVHAAREGVLFTYSSLSCNDSGLFEVAGEALAAGKSPVESMKSSGFEPDMKKRGSVRTVFDGRYKFSRYFAPVDRNRPATLEDLYDANDVELFDLQSDPSETLNLATDKEKNRDRILAMSAKLEAVIRAEIGVDDGREMPEIASITWTVDRADL